MLSPACLYFFNNAVNSGYAVMLVGICRRFVLIPNKRDTVFFVVNIYKLQNNIRDCLYQYALILGKLA